jgi:hypothetical protein
MNLPDEFLRAARVRKALAMIQSEPETVGLHAAISELREALSPHSATPAPISRISGDAPANLVRLQGATSETFYRDPRSDPAGVSSISGDAAWVSRTDDVSDADAAQSVLTGRSIPEIQADIATQRELLAAGVPCTMPEGEAVLPPLPEPAGTVMTGYVQHEGQRMEAVEDAYTAEQMRAYRTLPQGHRGQDCEGKLPKGWKITRKDSLFKPITITAPNGYSAYVTNTAVNPENVLYMLAEALLGDCEGNGTDGGKGKTE